MTVCYFGLFRPDYVRNQALIKALRVSGVTVLEVSDRSKGFAKYLRLFAKHWKVRSRYDLMIVGFPGQSIVPFARLLTRKPIVFDALVSLYDSVVIERKQCSSASFRGRWCFLLDWLSARLATTILLDTREHAAYYSKLLSIPEGKCWVVYHGCDDAVFYPHPAKRDETKFVVEFHGYITPTNGMDFVMRAMKLLSGKPYELRIIGGGQEYGRMQDLARELGLSSVQFFPAMPRERLLPFISQARAGLGFFNNRSGRVQRVIANKIYEMMALKIPVVTADSPAIRELFTHRENIYVCQPGDPHAIAEALEELRNSEKLRSSIANNAYVYYKNNLVPTSVGRSFVTKLASLITK